MTRDRLTITADELAAHEAIAAIGVEAYGAAHGQGQRMTVDEVFAYALDEGPREHQDATPTDPDEQLLTPREREIATLVAEGLTNRQIASRLTISPRTAEGHVERILTKLGFTTRTQIVTWVTTRQPGG